MFLCHRKKNQYLKNLDKPTIFHFPPGEAMYLMWGRSFFLKLPYRDILGRFLERDEIAIQKKFDSYNQFQN